MRIQAALRLLSVGLPMTREAWPEDHKLVVASDPITGATTRLFVFGDLCYSCWEPSDSDRQATDWKPTGEEPVELTGPREVL